MRVAAARTQIEQAALWAHEERLGIRDGQNVLEQSLERLRGGADAVSRARANGGRLTLRTLQSVRSGDERKARGRSHDTLVKAAAAIDDAARFLRRFDEAYAGEWSERLVRNTEKNTYALAGLMNAANEALQDATRPKTLKYAVAEDLSLVRSAYRRFEKALGSDVEGVRNRLCDLPLSPASIGDLFCSASRSDPVGIGPRTVAFEQISELHRQAALFRAPPDQKASWASRLGCAVGRWI